MSKINKTFVSGEKLNASDLNTIVSTVNGELYDESGGSKLSELSLKKYEKPQGGIPAIDLAEGVVPDVSGKVDKPSEDGTEGQVLGLGADGETIWKDGGGNTDDIEEVAAAALVETREYIDSLLNGITKRGKIIMSNDVVNNLDSISSLTPLSALMGKVLYKYIIDNEEVIASAFNDLCSLLKPTAVAPVYAANKVYNVGDCVMYEGNLYKCVEQISAPEFFDATKWEQTNIINIINNL